LVSNSRMTRRPARGRAVPPPSPPRRPQPPTAATRPFRSFPGRCPGTQDADARPPRPKVERPFPPRGPPAFLPPARECRSPPRRVPPPSRSRRTARPDNKGAWPSTPRGASVGTRPPGNLGHVPGPSSACYGTARRGHAGGVARASGLSATTISLFLAGKRTLRPAMEVRLIAGLERAFVRKGSRLDTAFFASPDR